MRIRIHYTVRKRCNNYLLIDSSLGHHGVGSGYWHGHLMPITTPSDKKSTDQRGERSLAEGTITGGQAITRAPPSGADLALWSRSWLERSFDHRRLHPHISFILFTSFSTKFFWHHHWELGRKSAKEEVQLKGCMRCADVGYIHQHHGLPALSSPKQHTAADLSCVVVGEGERLVASGGEGAAVYKSDPTATAANEQLQMAVVTTAKNPPGKCCCLSTRIDEEDR